MRGAVCLEIVEEEYVVLKENEISLDIVVSLRWSARMMATFLGLWKSSETRGKTMRMRVEVVIEPDSWRRRCAHARRHHFDENCSDLTSGLTYSQCSPEAGERVPFPCAWLGMVLAWPDHQMILWLWNNTLTSSYFPDHAKKDDIRCAVSIFSNSVTLCYYSFDHEVFI